MMALDEVHELRNGNDRLGAAMMIAERSQVVLGLTATPIVGGVKVSFSPAPVKPERLTGPKGHDQYRICIASSRILDCSGLCSL